MKQILTSVDPLQLILSKCLKTSKSSEAFQFASQGKASNIGMVACSMLKDQIGVAQLVTNFPSKHTPLGTPYVTSLSPLPNQIQYVVQKNKN